jgi:hypothetical protein
VPPSEKPKALVVALPIGWIWQFLRVARSLRQLLPPRQSFGREPSATRPKAGATRWCIAALLTGNIRSRSGCRAAGRADPLIDGLKVKVRDFRYFIWSSSEAGNVQRGARIGVETNASLI